MRRTLVWSGVDAPRMEIAYVDMRGDVLQARGTQIGLTYELRYELEADVLRAGVVRGGRVVLRL